MASDELTQAVEAQAQAALCERLDELLAVLPAEEADQIRAELEAAEAAEEERVLAEERAIAEQSLTAAERERQDQIQPGAGEDPADWRDRMILLHDGHMPLVIPGGADPSSVVSVDLGTLPRRKRERLMRIRPDRPDQLRRHVVALLRPPVCHGARPRAGARPRGRRERRTVRSSARSGDSGSSEPGGDGEPHGRSDDVELLHGRRCSR